MGLAFGGSFGESIRVPGLDSLPELKGGGPFVSVVTSDFFATVGTPIVKGRPFTTDDRAGSAAVAIVNQTMAAALWPGEDAVGKCFHIAKSTECAQIVGIAADSRRGGLREEKAMAYYVPFGQLTSISGARLVVRPRGDARSMIAELRKALFAMDPGITFVYVTAMQDTVDENARPWRLGAAMFIVMGAIALIVAAIGLYSLISYFVANRRHEIGIRIALGAQSSNIIRLVVGNGLLLATAGVVSGCALAFAGARFIEPLLFETSATDPRIFATVAIALLVVAFVATIVPAVRARGINPADAMRAE